MRFTLALANLYPRFEGRIFSGDEVEHGKPSPDLFLGLEHEGSGVRAALWIAASRARESLSADRLFDDPWAAALAGPLGCR
jgi:Leucine carboxyl methyltransferase.